jgi:hypothetical protein
MYAKKPRNVPRKMDFSIILVGYCKYILFFGVNGQLLATYMA